jgi:hypothetical protein
MIKKVKGGYQVVSTKGRNLGGPYESLAAAKRRLRAVEFFKHRIRGFFCSKTRIRRSREPPF